MSKKYRVKKKRTPKEELKAEAKKINWKLWGITIAVTLLFFCIYQIGLYYKIIAVMYIYSVLMGVLILIYGILNRGFSKFEPENIVFPDKMTEEEKQKALEKETKRRKTAKYFLIPLIGVMVTLAFDVVYLFYLEPIINK